MNTSPFATDEAALLEVKTIPFFERQLHEAKKRLKQLKKEKSIQPVQETDPPKSEAYSAPAA